VNFLQWLTIAFTGFLFLLVLTYWFGWSKPEAGKDYRWQMFSALLSIEGLLLGVFLQEGRVQQKTQEVAEAQRVITTYSSQVNHLENLTTRLSRQVTSPEARASVDSIRTVIDNTKKLPVMNFRPMAPIRRP
jgi:hypothetical protein